MKKLLGVIFLSTWLFGPPSNLEQASEAYAKGDYKASIDFFDRALDQYPLKSTAIRYNIGQNYFAMDSLSGAMEAWVRTFNDREPELTSMAYNNQGVAQVLTAEKLQEAAQQQMQQNQGNPNPGKQAAASGEDVSNLLKAALLSFQEALRRFPDNEEARFNYELLKRRLEQNQNQQQQNQDQQQQQNQDQNQDEQQDQQQQDQDSQDQQKNSDQQDQSTQQQKQNRKPKEGAGEDAEYKEISMEMAKQLLEGMKQNEKQFLQELRKSKKSKDDPSDGPDW